MANDHDWLQLCDDIDDGEFDSGLEDIARAVASRRDIVHRRNARRLQRSIQKGDMVMLTNKITPRYLEGCQGEVKSIRDGAAVVKLSEMPSHRGRPPADGPKQTLLVPFIHLVKLDDNVTTLKAVNDSEGIGDDEEYEDELDDDDDD
jgi:hypothetical protein